MYRTLTAIDFARIRPGSDVYGPGGEFVGVVSQVSGDRFMVAAERQVVWVPNDWVRAAHAHTVVVGFGAAGLDGFRRVKSSRWCRR
ncbi:MAG: hypothetical protein ACSLFM_06385 [Tepidiformaceae bacterium]